MSNLSTQVFGDMNYLYEHIANRDAQQLNENSDHYDEEFAELVEDIFYNISYSMASEGYSANGILDFLSKASEQDILEKYYDCTISEGLVSKEYILEQLEIIDEGIGSLFKVLGKGIGMGAKALAKGTGTALKGTGRTISVATQRAIGPGGRKAIKGAVTKVKDIAKGAKAALTSPTAKKIGLGALGAGALVGLPYVGAKLAGAGSGGQGSSPTGGKPGTPGSSSNTDFTKGSALAKLGGRQGRVKDGEFRTMGWSKQSADRYNKAKGATTPPAAAKPPVPAKPAASSSGGGSGSGGGSKPAAKPAAKKPFIGTTKGGTKYEIRTPTTKERDASAAAGGGEAGVRAAVAAGKPTTGPEVSNVQKSQAGADVAAIQAKERANFEKKNKEVMASTQKESYDAYELVLEYLFDYGHANTIEEAEYIMTELDESFIQSLVETYEANVLAEEVTEWVNELVEEGHDLSKYTWDDMVDYYFSEAKVDKVVDKELENTGVSANVRMGVKKGSRDARKRSERPMTGTQLRLAGRRSKKEGERQDAEREISGARRGTESSTEY